MYGPRNKWLDSFTLREGYFPGDYQVTPCLHFLNRYTVMNIVATGGSGALNQGRGIGAYRARPMDLKEDVAVAEAGASHLQPNRRRQLCHL
jgi:hypothetical protein